MFFFAACDESLTTDEGDQTNDVENPIVDAKEPISEMPYSQIPNKEYTIDLAHWDIPNNSTNPEKTTDNLQAAIDWAVGEGYGKIRLPAGHYLIGKERTWQYQVGLDLRSNMALLLDKDAVIEMAPNDKGNQAAILVWKSVNVLISGGTILGDRYQHTYSGGTSHNEGHLIEIKSENVTVENVALGRAAGDAILMVGEPKNIDIRGNNIFDNRRQGVSVAGGENVVIENNEIHHTKGTNPQFGIDIESGTYSQNDIKIRNNHFHHNHGGDICNRHGRNVLIENNIMEQGEGSEYRDGPIVYWNNADLTIRNNEITMLTRSLNGWIGIIMYSKGDPKTNPATTHIYENTVTGCGFYMYKGADLNIHDNKIIEGFMCFKEMSNLTLNDNDVIYNSSAGRDKAYSFFQVTGSASGNTYKGEPIDFPLSSEPWDGGIVMI